MGELALTWTAHELAGIGGETAYLFSDKFFSQQIQWLG